MKYNNQSHGPQLIHHSDTQTVLSSCEMLFGGYKNKPTHSPHVELSEVSRIKMHVMVNFNEINEPKCEQF
jgi:hypothetical protein